MYIIITFAIIIILVVVAAAYYGAMFKQGSLRGRIFKRSIHALSETSQSNCQVLNRCAILSIICDTKYQHVKTISSLQGMEAVIDISNICGLEFISVRPKTTPYEYDVNWIFHE